MHSFRTWRSGKSMSGSDERWKRPILKCHSFQTLNATDKYWQKIVKHPELYLGYNGRLASCISTGQFQVDKANEWILLVQPLLPYQSISTTGRTCIQPTPSCSRTNTTWKANVKRVGKTPNQQRKFVCARISSFFFSNVCVSVVWSREQCSGATSTRDRKRIGTSY